MASWKVPLYQLGNPQLRIFRPNFFMTLVRPGVPQPEDTVQFRISMEMTRLDVKNYLEKIYNVPVSAVRTRIQYGANNKRNHKNQKVKIPDYKVAYVQLGQGQTFQFPNLFPEKKKPQNLALWKKSKSSLWRMRDRGKQLTPDEEELPTGLDFNGTGELPFFRPL